MASKAEPQLPFSQGVSMHAATVHRTILQALLTLGITCRRRRPSRVAPVVAAAGIILAACAGTAEAISNRTLGTLAGSYATASYGISVATGDVNGDGYVDTIVGSHDDDQAGVDAGKVEVDFGGPAFCCSGHLTFFGAAAGDFFGYSVAAGDVNGDGFADVIVGAYLNDFAGGNAGRVYVYYGGAAPDVVADVIITGAAAGDQFGVSVASSGNVDGNQYAHVIVGAWGNDAGGVDAGRAYVYPGASGGLSTAATLTLTGAAANDLFGISVASAGDVDGDGYGDWIVGSRNDAGGVDAGRAYVYFGRADAVADLTLTGAAPGDYLGASVASAGDMNGDGYADVIVGATGSDAGGVDAGRAYVYYGGPVPNAVVDLTFTGGAAADYLGTSVARAGDVNGDGYADVIVGAYGSDFHLVDAGRAYVYLGGPVADAVADITLTGLYAGGFFGYSVASAGDFDRDGFDDVIIGSPNVGYARVVAIYPYQVLSPNGNEQWVGGTTGTVRWRGHDVADIAISPDGGASWTTVAVGVGGSAENEYAIPVPMTPTQAAKVRLSYSGQTAKRSTSDASDGLFSIVLPVDPPSAASRLQWTVQGEAVADAMGGSVSYAGDVNGDGYGDTIVGAPGYSGNRGRAYVYHGGPGADVVADLTLTGETVGDRFGVSVSTAGDWNADGYGDVIVGAEGYNTNDGRAYIYFGGPGADAVPDLQLFNPNVDALTGASVAAAGDVNGDGYSDVIVGSPGDGPLPDFSVVRIYYGGPGADNQADDGYLWFDAGAQLGRSVSSAGDMNGDGFEEWAAGAPGAYSSRGKVYLSGSGVFLAGEEPNDQFGYSVSSAGDVNGDGFGDLIVGAPGHGDSRGRAYVYHGGSALDDVPDLILSGMAATDSMFLPVPFEFGSAVSTAGDVNHDGYGDLVVGARGNGSNQGRVYVYYGGPGMDGVADHVFVDPLAGNLFGGSVSTAGDVNGDGHGDIIVGASGYNGSQGRARLYDWNRYFLTTPNGGETWNVGATKTVSWLGSEPADVWLSDDGGNTHELLESGIGGGATNVVSLRVPHTPTKFARIRITPADPAIGGSDRSDSLFTIQTSVALLSMLAAPLPQGGASITWATDPAPEDLAGFRLERSTAASSDWRTVVSLTRETTVTDPTGGPGSRYRLFAVNGFGEKLWLGESSIRSLATLSAWPLPYRGGSLNISFATAGGLGGGRGQADVKIFDVSGRLVRRITAGEYEAGHQVVTWDGQDERGRKVAGGIYFLRATSGGEARTLRLSVLR